MHGCKRPTRLAPSPVFRGVQWVSEITRRHAKYNWHERVQNNNESTARVVDLRRKREVVRSFVVAGSSTIEIAWFFDRGGKLVGMSETREIAREIIPHARNVSLNIARTRDYFGISCHRHRREFLQLRLLHPSVASDIERILRPNAERERERKREGKRGWGRMISRAAIASASEPRREIIPLGLSLSKRGIVSRPTQKGRGREFSVD